MVPDRLENLLIIKILDYLLQKKVLKVESIEGMDQYFNDLEKMIRDYNELRDTKFESYISYLKSLTKLFIDTNSPAKLL
jgi:hypothetical protein